MKTKHLLLTLLFALMVPWTALAQQALPYSYGFEDNDLSIDGWTTQNPSGLDASKFMISTSAKRTGTYGFQFSSFDDSGAHTQYLISPELNAATGVVAQFYYRGSSSYGDELFKVGYSTTDTEISSFTFGDEISTGGNTSWTQSEEFTFPAGTKYVAIYYYADWQYYLYVDDFSFTAPPSCIKPSGLAATLTSGDGTVATLNWTAGGTETNWVLEYGTAADFTGATSVNVSNRPTQDLTGLTPETTYYARVKANCGGGDYSEWCNDVCTFTPTDAYTLTVNDGTVTNSYVPYYSYYHDSQQRSEFIIPASSLEDMAWGTITSMKFYPNYSYTTGASIQVYLMEVEATTFSDATFYTEADATVVYNGTLTISSTDGMTINFNGDGFEYSGGNLLVGFYQASGGSGYYQNNTCPFYGVTAEGASVSMFYSTDYQALRNFLPKTTFNYEPGEAPTCFKPTGLTVARITARTADLGWQPGAGETQWQICLNDDETNLILVNENSYTLENLTPETDYTVKVRAYCSATDQSSWTNSVSFTTDEACHTPTNVEADDITAVSALITWDGVEDTYTLKYADWRGNRGTSHLKFADVVKNMNRTATDLTKAQVTAAPNAQPKSSTMGGQTRDGWYYYDNGTISTNFGYSGSMFWAVMFPAGSYSGNMLTKIAVWEDSENNTQPITVYVCDGATAPENILYAEEFDVVAEDDFHVVTLATPIEIDPTQNLWIVLTSSDSYPISTFRSSTETDANARWCSFDGGTWYDLADVGGDAYYGWMVRAYTETLDPTALNWTTVENITTNSYPLTNLTAETRYVVQVQANCGLENGNSNWASTCFTTLPACLAPTDLDYTAFTAHTVTLGWTENGDATAWDIEVTGPTTYTLNVTTNPYTVEGLADNTTYSFKVRAKCSDTDFSEWTTRVTVTTDVACYAPTGLAISDITVNSAVATWNSGAASCELRYTVAPEDSSTAWLVYDDGIYSTSIGSSSSSSRTWGVMYPATMLGSNTVLSTVKFFETGSLESYVTINIYQGGDNAPETLLYTEVVDPLTAAGWHTVALADAVTIDPTQNLWISLSATGVYPMPACTVNDANNRWVCTDGVWQQLNSNLSDYGWMIRAYLGSMTWVNVSDLTTYNYTMDNLNPETTYHAQVRSNCQDVGEGYSWWTDVIFTTLSDCIAPWNLTADNITANTAELSWEGYKDSYEMRYRTAEIATYPVFAEGFEGGTMPNGWTQEGDGTWNISAGYGYNSIGTHTGNYNALINHSDRENETFLISPMMDLSGQSDLNLNFWFINYNWGDSDIDQLYVYYRVDGGEWNELWSNTEDHQEWTASGDIALPNLAANYQIGFKMIDKWGHGLGLDDITIGEYIQYAPAGEWVNVTDPVTSPYTLEGLNHSTAYEVQVRGAGCGDDEWSASASFTTETPATVTQTVTLTAGVNWFSTNVEITLDDLKAALVAALPGTTIKITSRTQATTYNGSRWRGTLSTLDVTQMYKIEVTADCEITLEGAPINPAEHPVTIVQGVNWIAFPLNTNMTVTNAFAGFAVSGDKVISRTQSTTYNGTRWRGTLSTLEPGCGYIYYSAATEDRTFTFPTAK